MNIISFDGNIGKDSEIQTTSTGKKVLSFSVGSTAGFGNSKITNWFYCSIWGDTKSDTLVNYLKKGVKVTVYGTLRLEEIQKKNGEGKTIYPKVTVSDISIHSHRDTIVNSNISEPVKNNAISNIDDDLPF